MNNFIFRSKLQPNLCYKVHADHMEMWDAAYHCSARVLDTAISCFDTCGDGMTQHSLDTVVTEHRMFDFLYSLASYLLAEPPCEEVQRLVERFWPAEKHYNSETLGFYYDLRPAAEGAKTKYVCKQDQKVSTAESKRHDKRWFAVPSWANGTAGAIHRLLSMDPSGEERFSSSRDLLRQYSEYSEIGEYVSRRYGYSSESVPIVHFGLQESPHADQIDRAFTAVDSIVCSWRRLSAAKRSLENIDGYLQRQLTESSAA